STVYQCRVFR
ncbi:hypothetical protein VCHENC02_4205B, partial [Vibrio harveyi]